MGYTAGPVERAEKRHIGHYHTTQGNPQLHVLIRRQPCAVMCGQVCPGAGQQQVRAALEGAKAPRGPRLLLLLCWKLLQRATQQGDAMIVLVSHTVSHKI